MGRLIDADELMKKKKEQYAYHDITDSDFEELINSQPTAYDVEKVVAELDNKMLDSLSGKAETVTGMNGILASQYSGEVSAYEKAIEIVRKGGVE